MTRNITIVAITLILCTAAAHSDTFTDRQTGEVFHGFVTQKQKQSQTLVYVEKDKAFKALELAKYKVVRDGKGRRNSVVVIPIRTEEALISQGVSDIIAKTIIDASNKGPKYIVLEIDCPGGYGQYMKNICLTVANTTNCPVIAYISGGGYGGAFSAAAAVAISCEKVFIAGDAAIGSLAPLAGAPGMRSGIDEYNAMFSSNSLAGFRTYISAIATNKSRPEALAMALLDKTIEIIEVEDRDGNRRLIKKGDEKPLDEIIRTVSKVETRSVASEEDEGGVKDVTQTVLTLTADEALDAGLVDKVVGTRDEILTELGLADAQITYSRGVESAIRKFVANKRNIDKALIEIDFLEERVDILKGQYDRLDEQIRTSPTTREQSYGNDYYGGGRGSRRNYNLGGRNDPRYRGDYGGGREYVTGVEVPVGAYALVEELAVTVTELVREYKRVVGLAKRDPGALPVNVTMGQLQRRHDQTVALHNNLFARFR